MRPSDPAREVDDEDGDVGYEQEEAAGGS